MKFLQAVGNWFLSLSGTLAASVLKAVVVAVIGILVIRLVMKIVKKILEKSKLDKQAHGLILTLLRTIMYVLLALMVASSLGIDVTGVVALASVATLAVSLALQNMLANVIGGFTILYTHPFHAGDYVEIAGQSGSVLEVGMAYTKLTTPDNKVVSIPNSAVVAAEIVNYSTTGTRRVSLDISVSYDTPAQQVIDTLVKLADHPAILEEPAKPFAALVGFGESTIQYTLRFWVKSEDYWDVLFDANARLKQTFDDAGVKMTYPHLNVHIEK